MEPIKPIEGISKEAEASVLAERYRGQRAQTTPAITPGEEAADAGEKRRPEAEKKQPAQTRHTYAEFEINRETREVIVRIIEAESGKLIRTIPPDELAKELIKGNFQPSQLRRWAVLV